MEARILLFAKGWQFSHNFPCLLILIQILIIIHVHDSYTECCLAQNTIVTKNTKYLLERRHMTSCDTRWHYFFQKNAFGLQDANASTKNHAT